MFKANKLGKVYLAGGWFDEEQEERLYAVYDILKDCDYEVFFPKEEALCKPDSSIDWRKEVFSGNCNAIKTCSFMVCITDKKDIGTIFEAGYAYSSGVPIIYFAETLGDNPFNLMLAQSGIEVVSSREELRELLNSDELYESLTENSIVSEYKGTVE